MWYNQETNIQQDETVMVSESTYLSEEQEERFKVSEEALLEAHEIFEIVAVFQKNGLCWYRIKDEQGNIYPKYKYFYELNKV